MNIKEMTIEELEARQDAIVAELDNPEADLDALENEARSIKEEIEARKAEEAKKAEIRKAAANDGVVVKKFEEEKKTMTNEEVRASKEYVDAYAKYIKTGEDAECRSLLTENVTGAVPVPVLVDSIVRTAWDNEQILSRVRKTYFRGNLKVSFEISATGAVVHTEGQDAPDEENLVLGIVTMIPANIKKWIRISDEAVTMGGEAFLRYVYDELVYQIAKKLAADIIADIKNAPQTSNSVPTVAKITEAPAVTTVSKAFANLSDEATNNVIIMNKLTYADFIAAQAAGAFAFDPFNGLTVLFNNSLKAYSAAASGEVYMIVGDLSGVQANFPEGDGIALKYDDLTEAEADMVKIVGRQYVAHALTASGRFCVVAKA